MMTEGMPYVPHAIGLITMAQTVVNKISISDKVQWVFLTNCFTLGGFNGSFPLSGCSGWLVHTLFQFEKWERSGGRITYNPLLKERGQQLLHFLVCACLCLCMSVCTWAPAGCGVSLSLAANVLALAVLASYPCRLCVFVLQQANELTKALLHRLQVVGGTALQDPALPSGQWLQLKVLLDLPAETQCGQPKHSVFSITKNTSTHVGESSQYYCVL